MNFNQCTFHNKSTKRQAVHNKSYNNKNKNSLIHFYFTKNKYTLCSIK